MPASWLKSDVLPVLGLPTRATVSVFVRVMAGLLRLRFNFGRHLHPTGSLSGWKRKALIIPRPLESRLQPAPFVFRRTGLPTRLLRHETVTFAVNRRARRVGETPPTKTKAPAQAGTPAVVARGLSRRFA